ncbi:hypothetical protein JQ631_12505 [Bradyrhizobium manausense]|uniref:hypothetical protein n=1 Tax=Bradyrhizobium manausense TaxID=989370 RepID=UPI001BAA9C0B|nr:hypothetical protein [Bradyrhizobium manausense]MBR0789898.1 hypothetical protein [Bradyrhizobium manausense]
MGYLLYGVTIFASVLIVDYLARRRGWSRDRWGMAALTLGPLAVPLIYLVDAAKALRNMMTNALRQ